MKNAFSKLLMRSVFVAVVALLLVTGLDKAMASNANFDAVVTRVDIPRRIEIGKTARITVSVTNEGYADWKKHREVKLYSKITSGPSGRAMNIPELMENVEACDARSSGDKYTFQYQVTAPKAPGEYTMEWQMGAGGKMFGRSCRASFEIFGVNMDAKIHESDIRYSPNPVNPAKNFSFKVVVNNTGDVPFHAFNPSLKARVTRQPSGSNVRSLTQVYNCRFFRPNGKKWTFEKSLKAPEQEGAYEIRWQMYNGSAAFGEAARKTLNVVAK